ncbi:MAG: hypothetical protein ABSF24_10180 [Candidatus Bathyarchaeia archaeon]|jgi:hypothetical protein
MRGRNIPEFKPLPLRRRIKVKTSRRYVRFYGRYRDANGGLRGFEYKVKISEKLWRDRKLLATYIRIVCSKMKEDHQMPVHVKGEAYPDFAVLLGGTDWVRIRRVENYDVSVPS